MAPVMSEVPASGEQDTENTNKLQERVLKRDTMPFLGRVECGVTAKIGRIASFPQLRPSVPGMGVRRGL